jgi:Flp pilus assembly protein TadG
MFAVRMACLNLRRALRRFKTVARGSVAIFFALSLIPILAFVGLAVDYSRANALKTKMQAALDATALMVSKNAATLNETEIQDTAESYFLAQFDRSDAKNVNFTATYSKSGGSQLLVSASADMTTEFLPVIGYHELTVSGTATAKWGSSRLRVALVLDTTGSMADDGKIDALKTATKNLLTQLQNAVTNSGDVYVSIIPFSKNVNLDGANYGASWIDWTDWDSEPAILKTSKPYNWDQIGPGSSCPFSSSSYGFRCTTSPANNSSTTSTISSSGAYAGYICPGIDGGNKDSTKIGIYYNGCYDSVPTTATTTHVVSSGRYASCYGYSNCSCTGSSWSKVCQQTTTTTGAPYTHTWIKNDHSTWNGCVTDRGTSSGPSQDYDRLVTAPTASIKETLFPAEQNSYCSPNVMGLSDNWTGMASAVDSLYPLGATNQPIGLVWGWQSLAGGGPLTVPSKDPNYSYTDVIILLSDGLNTLDRWYGNGSSTNTSVDARMYDSAGKGTCANINAAGVILYTIQVNTGGDPTSTLLKNCAGTPGKFPDSSKFFLLTKADQIITTFDTIGTNLTKLRIAQ